MTQLKASDDKSLYYARGSCEKISLEADVQHRVHIRIKTVLIILANVNGTPPVPLVVNPPRPALFLFLRILEMPMLKDKPVRARTNALL